jgi:hypothetical protein
MKFLSILYCMFFSFHSLAKNKEGATIKIYVSDAETGKNIPNAKVTLEGYEIPAIQGSYQKAGAYYYFKQVPQGYNTVMVYHSKYNEKGFQDVNGLPKVLRLKLQDYRYVSYSFEKPILKEMRKSYSKPDKYLEKIMSSLLKIDSIKGKYFRYLYNEDPFHIAVISKYNPKDFFADEGTKKLLNELKLEQTVYKSGTPHEYKFTFYGFSDGSFYREQYTEGNEADYCETSIGLGTAYRVYFFHKNNKTRFSRYNCKEIQELRKAGFKVAVLTNRVIEYFADVQFNPKSFDAFYSYQPHRDIYEGSIDNFEFGKVKNPEQAFFGSAKKEKDMFFGKSKFREFEGADGDNVVRTLFFLVEKKAGSAVGLGALDDVPGYEKMIADNFYFFNNISGVVL